LDPDATGVLVLGVGQGTKLLQFVTGVDKTYVGELVLGVETSTLDAAGDVTAIFDMTVSPEQVAAAADGFVGDILQVPPMVSAVRVNGKRLHELARAGVEIEREPRPVTVHSVAATPTDDPLVYRLEVACGSGTYIRSLAADIGAALGGGAHLRALRRTSVGTFGLDRASSLDDIVLHPVADLLEGMPRIEVGDDVADQVRNGRSLGPAPGSGQMAILAPDGQVLAIYEARDGQFRPVKVLAP
ncbi:MAG: tRNA pseudouridine(55) synthase TruB, partial [Actinomycetota bacterium]|nr:tRNA pseudouridine(55) synthase TruB [Actinomycetota bacterium]